MHIPELKDRRGGILLLARILTFASLGVLLPLTISAGQPTLVTGTFTPASLPRDRQLDLRGTETIRGPNQTGLPPDCLGVCRQRALI